MVADAEKFYASRGVPTRFQISPRACPEGLDTFLTARGYRRESPMSLQAAPTTSVLERVPARSFLVQLTNQPTSTWFRVWHAVHSHGGDTRSEREMLARVERPGVYASAMSGDDVVAVGRVVADGDWAGVFGMATVRRARGKGAACAVLAALADWAAAREAGRMYLQVERGNIPAIRLYEQAGFGELCVYHYRTAP